MLHTEHEKVLLEFYELLLEICYGQRPAGQGGYNRGPRPAAPAKEGGNN